MLVECKTKLAFLLLVLEPISLSVLVINYRLVYWRKSVCLPVDLPGAGADLIVGGVPVLPALTESTSSSAVVEKFASNNGYPIMIKAVDGGGGRGIRLIHDKADLEAGLRRAIEESPSKAVFVEKAAVSGYRHIEVQIVGDNHGNVTHLFERECSIQRRYQKVVEVAPSSISDRQLVGQVIDSALRMARKVGREMLY